MAKNKNRDRSNKQQPRNTAERGPQQHNESLETQPGRPETQAAPSHMQGKGRPKHS
ncbi:hypothetical protein NLX86_27240 [Streptomyces sp. A3M-1-3]|uniref:hypothetical protein n=1 Tax=Streptomyces sp. A3M-1-3 TaxID=2962044 RepID=UPI0020B8F70A|nr:hypothetical protein [Streptomyces sp. A3M-1-3]MCP3821654.1 hypothetical protein [Streptomyces sp. A3M-1-3]